MTTTMTCVERRLAISGAEERLSLSRSRRDGHISRAVLLCCAAGLEPPPSPSPPETRRGGLWGEDGTLAPEVGHSMKRVLRGCREGGATSPWDCRHCVVSGRTCCHASYQPSKQKYTNLETVLPTVAPAPPRPVENMSVAKYLFTRPETVKSHSLSHEPRTTRKSLNFTENQ